MTREELRSALAHPNVQAFLRVIREGESGQTDDAYKVMYGGRYFHSFLDHPRVKNTAAGITSTAAGAYQFLERTWDGLVKKYGFDDFMPATQDEAAVALIAGRGALQDLLRGDISEVLEKCSYEWASLPPGRYGQPVLDAKRVYATYEKWLHPTTTPVEVAKPEKKMPAPFLTVAIAALSELLPSLIRMKSKSPTGELNAQIAEKVMEVVLPAVGATNAQEAVEKIMKDPAALQAADQAVQANYFMLEEAGGGGIKGARDFAVEMTSSGPPWRQIAFSAMLGLLAVGVVIGGGAVMAYFLVQSDMDKQMQAQILDYYKAAGFIVLGYVFGSSAGSRRKDELK
jgi:muramidase (phage lysozyme)